MSPLNLIIFLINMYCKNCRKKINKEVKFCTYCGEDIVSIVVKEKIGKSNSVFMFVEGHLYTFITVADSGYSSNFKRLLNSISFNPLGI